MRWLILAAMLALAGCEADGSGEKCVENCERCEADSDCCYGGCYMIYNLQTGRELWKVCLDTVDRLCVVK